MDANQSKNRPMERVDLVRNADLPRTHKFVLLTLATYADAGGLCWPSLDRLGSNTGLHRSTLKRILKDLDECGVARVVGNAMGGAGRSVRRRINWAMLEGGSATAEGATLYTWFAQRETAKRIKAAAAIRQKGVHSEPLSEAKRGSLSNKKGFIECQKGVHCEPLTMPSMNQPREPAMGTEEISSLRSMDGMGAVARPETLCGRLKSLGVRGANLDRLSAMPGLTVAIVNREWETIRRDRSVHSPAAVLVRRLTKAFKIDLRQAPGYTRPGESARRAERQIYAGQAAQRRRRETPGTPEHEVAWYWAQTQDLHNRAIAAFCEREPSANEIAIERGYAALLADSEIFSRIIEIARELARSTDLAHTH